MEFVCKIPTLEEVKKRWEYLVNTHEEDRINWKKWQKEAVERFESGKIIIYYGILDDEIICETTAVIKPIEDDKYTQDLIGEKKAYLSAFRVNKEFEGQGYFSKIYKYMLDDLKSKGYEEVSLGVEPTEERNKQIYNHYGFTDFVKETHEVYPNGEEVVVDYYKKKL